MQILCVLIIAVEYVMRIRNSLSTTARRRARLQIRENSSRVATLERDGRFTAALLW